MNSPVDRIWQQLWNMPKDNSGTLQCPPRHIWLHHGLPKTTNKTPQYCWTPTNHSAYKNISGGMVKYERMQLIWNIRPKIFTPQSMFTVALTLIFQSLTFPYSLHNRMCTRGWEKPINVILEKKGKGFLTSNLMNIYLMEADFNFNNKILAR